MSIKLDMDTLRYIAALEDNTGAQVKDCFAQEDLILYVVEKGQMGLAIGKIGSKVKDLKKALGKEVKIVEFAEDPVTFTNNFLGTLELKKVELQEGDSKKSIVIEADYKTKGAILGRNGKKIQILKDLLKRHHTIDNVVVR